MDDRIGYWIQGKQDYNRTVANSRHNATHPTKDWLVGCGKGSPHGMIWTAALIDHSSGVARPSGLPDPIQCRLELGVVPGRVDADGNVVQWIHDDGAVWYRTLAQAQTAAANNMMDMLIVGVSGAQPSNALRAQLRCCGSSPQDVPALPYNDPYNLLGRVRYIVKKINNFGPPLYSAVKIENVVTHGEIIESVGDRFGGFIDDATYREVGWFGRDSYGSVAQALLNAMPAQPYGDVHIRFTGTPWPMNRIVNVSNATTTPLHEDAADANSVRSAQDEVRNAEWTARRGLFNLGRAIDSAVPTTTGEIRLQVCSTAQSIDEEVGVINGGTYVVIDVENHGNSKVSLVSMRGDALGENHVVQLDCLASNEAWEATGRGMRLLLSNPNLAIGYHDIRGDARSLFHSFGARNTTNVYDTQKLAPVILRDNNVPMGLIDLARHILPPEYDPILNIHRELKIELQRSDWSQITNPLTEEQRRYNMLDAWLTDRIFRQLMELASVFEDEEWLLDIEARCRRIAASFPALEQGIALGYYERSRLHCAVQWNILNQAGFGWDWDDETDAALGLLLRWRKFTALRCGLEERLVLRDSDVTITAVQCGPRLEAFLRDSCNYP